MTLVEVTISVAILAVITAGALSMAASTTKAIGTGTAAADLDQRAQTAMDRLGAVLRTTSRTNVSPALPVAAPLTLETETLTFSRVTGIDDALQEPIWGLPEQILFESSPLDPADGVDNDRNGVVDDGRVVLIEDPGGASPRRRILVRDVTWMLDGEIEGNAADDNGNGLVDERGLSFEVRERGVTVRLTLACQDPSGRVVTTTTERSFAFRNSAP